MRIAILMPIADARGGAEELLQRLLRELPDATLDAVIVFFERGPMVEEARALGLAVHVVPTGRLRSLSGWLGAVTSLTTLFETCDVDLVVSWMTKAHLYGGPAARRAGLPAVWYQHGVPNAGDAVTRIATLLPAVGVLACSDPIAQAQRALRPQRPVHTVEPCVDLGRFDPAQLPSPAEARHQLGLAPDGPLFGIVGRMQRWKGIHVFVEAMASVIAAHPDARGVIVGGEHPGEPGYAAAVDRQIADLGIDDRVRRVGFQKNVPLWMQAMDVVVHASDYEPFGMVIIEAMALGKPVIAGAEGGPATIITDGVNGLLSPYGKAQALASAMRRLAAAPDVAAALGRAARLRAQDFSQTAYRRRFESALRDARVAPSSRSAATPVTA